MNNLSKYLSDQKMTQAEFAHQIGVSPAFVSMIRHGTHAPSLKLAVRIQKITKGAVPADSWGTAKEAAE